MSSLCPIYLTPLKNPVIDKHGHTFEKEAIEAWLKKNATCPINKDALAINDTISEN